MNSPAIVTEPTTAGRIPPRRVREQQRRALAYTSEICDHLQAAMFHLANDRADLARRSLRTANQRYTLLATRRIPRCRELDLAFAAASAWLVTPQSYRSLVTFCHATICLVEWRSLRFTHTRYTTQTQPTCSGAT
jgi:hypothetical protein